MNRKNIINRIFQILLSPWAVLTGMATGVIIGIYFRDIAARIAHLGDIYLALLQMCIIPILITAVISSLGSLLMSKDAARHVGKIFLIFISGLLMASAIGILAGIIIGPGTDLDQTAQITLGKTIIAEESAFEKAGAADASVFIGFIKEMVPRNVVGAMSEGKNLPVLIFSALIGIAIGVVHSPGRKTLLESINVFYDALLEIIKWIMYGLPFGLCFLIASQVSGAGMDMMYALLKLVLVCYLCAFIMIIIYGFVIWLRLGGSFFASYAALKETFMVSLGTSSSFAAIPAALKGLQDNLHMDKQSSKLVIPLGVNLNPQGSVMHFAVSTIFIAQLYNVTPDISSISIIFIGVIFAGLAATGVPGVGSLYVLGLVLGPLGLPVTTAVIMLAAIDPILDPVVTMVNMHASCAASVLVGKKEEI